MALSSLIVVIILEKLKGVQHSVDVMITVEKMEILSMGQIVIDSQRQQLPQQQQLPLQQLQLLQQQQMEEAAVEATLQQLLSE